MEVMEEIVGVKRESVTCLVVRLELERSILVFTSFFEVSTINMAVELELERRMFYNVYLYTVLALLGLMWSKSRTLLFKKQTKKL